MSNKSFSKYRIKYNFSQTIGEIRKIAVNKCVFNSIKSGLDPDTSPIFVLVLFCSHGALSRSCLCIVEEKRGGIPWVRNCCYLDY